MHDLKSDLSASALPAHSSLKWPSSFGRTGAEGASEAKIHDTKVYKLTYSSISADASMQLTSFLNQLELDLFETHNYSINVYINWLQGHAERT